MINNPDVQRKAQEEIDRVIGTDRLPLLSDRGSLPYVEALIKEVARWHPTAPTGTLMCSRQGSQSTIFAGVPRRASRDDVYEGYFIPKGTVIMPNNWSVVDK